MSDATTGLERAKDALLVRIERADEPAPVLELHAETPLATLPPDIVGLIVGRVRAGLAPLGGNHPRQAIRGRVVIPSLLLALLDVAGLILSATGGHTVLAVIAGVLLVALLYLAFAGLRFIRADPLRVSAAQLAHVEAARTWRTAQAWDDTRRGGPWDRLVDAAREDVGRISASNAWTWASIAPQRARVELADTLHAIDARCFTLAGGDGTAPESSAVLRRVAGLRCYADALDALVARAHHDAHDLPARLPTSDDRELETYLGVVLEKGESGPVVSS